MRHVHVVAEAFVELADTLVAEFDLVEFLHRLCEHCRHLLDVSAAAVMLADHNGHLQLLAASPDTPDSRRHLRLDTEAGPAPACYLAGALVREPADSLLAVPMRLREQTLGVLTLFGGTGGQDDRLAQALADVATIGLMQQRTLHQRQVLAEQLQAALDSRIVIEQAKGVLAERHNTGVDRAFQMLRDDARRARRQIHEVAREIVEGGAGPAGSRPPQGLGGDRPAS